MTRTSRFVVPVAPPPQDVAAPARRAALQSSVTLGLLDNSKANADRLLELLASEAASAMPAARFVSARKDLASRPAPELMLARLEAEADVVVTAMGD